MPVTPDIIVRTQMRNRAKLRSFIWAIVHDEHTADDILQDVCVLAIAKADVIHDEEHLLLWMRQTARLEAFNALRRLNRTPLVLSDVTLDLLESDWGAMDREDTSARVEALRSCLKILTPRAKRMVTMRYVDNMDGTAMAEALNRKLKSVYVAMSRIHRVLADCIKARLQRGESPDA